MAQRPPRPTLKQRFGPHPVGGPRTIRQRLNRSATDSGWPLLTVNIATYALFAGYALDRALAGSVLFPVLGAAFTLGFVRTAYVMLHVARTAAARSAATRPAAARAPRVTPAAPARIAALRPVNAEAAPGHGVPGPPQIPAERMAA
ncbi:hypothetical protein OG871_23295 [Kitasatospora sp. NBC_00374]|uniref:hypothetical protein n=1 Tax=Kitasatospora sp. NBC_00374 TaxID=2975964 RepID=UPI0030E2C69B